MEDFFEYINKIHPLSKKSIEDFNKIIVKKSYSPKDIYCKSGTISDKIGFLKSGLVRAYIVTPKGKEYNKSLFNKGAFLGSFTSLVKKKPSLYTIECLTECVILSCNYNKFIKLVKLHNDIGELHRKSIENIYIDIVNRNINFLTLNATQHYLKIQKSIKNIDNLITQKQIANYLGITTIQLGRIKKTLKS